jgi:hypothetical protein
MSLLTWELLTYLASLRSGNTTTTGIGRIALIMGSRRLKGTLNLAKGHRSLTKCLASTLKNQNVHKTEITS